MLQTAVRFTELTTLVNRCKQAGSECQTTDQELISDIETPNRRDVRKVLAALSAAEYASLRMECAMLSLTTDEDGDTVELPPTSNGAILAGLCGLAFQLLENPSAFHSPSAN